MKLLITLFILFSVITLTSLSCRRDCENPNGRIDVPVSQKFKDTICHFSSGEQWLFQNSSGDKDTVIVGSYFSNYTIGNCRQVGRVPSCCENYWYEHPKLLLYFSKHDEGIKKPDTISFSKSINSLFYYDFNSESPASPVEMTVDGVTLNDVYLWQDPSVTNVRPYRTYWSITKGLVSYHYYPLNGNFIIYERTDL